MLLSDEAHKMIIVYTCGKPFHVNRPEFIYLTESNGGGYNVGYITTRQVTFEDRVETIETNYQTTCGDVARITFIDKDYGCGVVTTTYDLQPIKGE